MKQLLGLLFIFLTACAPEVQDATIPGNARPFAKINFAIDNNKAFIALRNVLESGSSAFVSTGTLQHFEGFRSYWVVVAGQSAAIYFKIENLNQTTTLRVLTDPSPPPQAQSLARDLDKLADAMATALGLASYKFQPDR